MDRRGPDPGRACRQPPSTIRPGRECGRVGLFGGSFNPAHAGHLHASRMALSRLDLDEIWWLVSPQNPLKDAADMAPFADRLASARRTARHPRIRVVDVETRLGTRYTIDTVTALQRRFPRIRFVLLIGADNLIQLPRWGAWNTLLRRVAVAAVARPSYSVRAMLGKVAQRYRHHRRPEGTRRRLACANPPAWTFLAVPTHPASATAIRRTRGNGGNGSPNGGTRRS